MHSQSVSFIIPAFNEESSISYVINSIRSSCKDIDIKEFEIIVVDNNSTDATAQIAKNYSAKVVCYETRNIGAVRNAGAKSATYEILCFVDADSEVTPKLLQNALSSLSSKKVISAVTHFKNYPSLSAYGVWFYNVISKYLKLGVGQFILIRKSDFESFGGFNETYFAFEDVLLTKTAKQKFGRAAVEILWTPIISSARKFEKDKDLKRFLLLLIAFVLGRDVGTNKDKLNFWYGKQETSNAVKTWILILVGFLLMMELLLQSGKFQFDTSQANPIISFIIFLSLTYVTIESRKFFAVIFLSTFILEIIGVAFGFPFGNYKYADYPIGLGILGVPFYIGLAWFLIANALNRVFKNWWAVGLSILIADIFLEEFALVKNLWIWNDAQIFTAPIQNYLSWFVIGAASYLIYKKFSGSNGSVFYPVISLALIFTYIAWTLVIGGLPILGILAMVTILLFLVHSLFVAIRELEG